MLSSNHVRGHVRALLRRSCRFFCFWVRVLGVYVVVQERQCVVFELFGRVRLIEEQPGIHFPWLKMGLFAPLVAVFGKKRVVDLRLDQSYLRSQPVNSEEGAPMGIGVWCGMFVSDPMAYLYKNWDPVGSLRANVSERDRALLEQHEALGTYARDTALHEPGRARRSVGQVARMGLRRRQHLHPQGALSRRRHDSANRAESRQSPAAGDRRDSARRRESESTYSARPPSVRRPSRSLQAAATRPRIVGAALGEIAKDALIASALFELLETQNLLQSPGLEVSVLPQGTQFVAAIPGATSNASAR